MAKNRNKTLDVSALETWLWAAACVLRGATDAPKYKDYILPLIFLKRLSDVFDDEVAGLSEEFGSEANALKLVEQDHKLVRFFLPKKSRWPEIAKHAAAGLGEFLTDAVRGASRENPRLSGVIDVTDFNATTAGQRIIDDDRLHAVVQKLNEYRLGIDDVEPDIFGRAYEYLLRKFAEGSGSSAGEFYTPREVGVLMARILDPQPGDTVYDPCCGSGGLLIKAHLRLVEKFGEKSNGSLRLPSAVAPLKLYGQEYYAGTFAMARMNAFIHDMEAEIALGDTMNGPAFTEADGSLRAFDIVTANPMWNQKFPANVYDNDAYDRFTRGAPPSSSADWGWIQHMCRSLTDTGKMAVVLDTGAVARGSGNQGANKERDIRKKFVDEDAVEAVFLLPENLFYNTTAPGIVLVINRNKEKKRRGKMLLVNGSPQFSKGRPKNFMEECHVAAMADAYLKWKTLDGLSAIITKDEAVRNDYNISPSRYISTGTETEVLPLDEAVLILRQAEDERAEVDRRLNKILSNLGL